ncbi:MULTISPECIES: LacI family DNA-binding transcriptional regulator [unclassified Aureimonas]|uniref:LacI family DNA-binding transcriptional regulator n=1 Tax=unclassified Aureimonas TaxID=2615206 RepID=UPI0006FD2FE5|nr:MULTISPECIES: LacI family DNA-binding transcriptional regulator [unclassified Aureimonas]KQT65952.1 hypothetical protein ASG62_20705 [Aureimonas sp. Leaf427]KQT73311.1 hypothetical protein ASG54_17185 [Aureimonas sp. Leaf460]
MSETFSPVLPTLRDVARHAEVSLATADRVVNRRPGVRPATIKRVEAAVRALGFERHAGAAALARRESFRAVALLPLGTNPFIERLADELVAAARLEGLRRLDLAVRRAERFDPESLASAIRAAAAEGRGVIAVGLDDPAVLAAIDAAAEAGLPVVTLVSDVPGSGRRHYVGIDNRAAGRVAASLLGRFAKAGPGEVLVLLGSLSLSDHRDRLDGFREALGERFPDLAVRWIVEGHDDAERAEAAVAAVLRTGPAPAAVYSAGAGASGLVAALAATGVEAAVVAHELTCETRPLLLSGALDALIVQDPGHEARSAVRVLMAALTGGAVSEDQERIRIEILLPDNLPK